MDVTLTIEDTAESLAVKALKLNGFDDVGNVRLVSAQRHDAADGTVTVRALGFQRIITLSLGVVSSIAAQSFLERWLLAAERSITRAGETAFLSLVDPSGVVADVSSGKLFHRFEVQLMDRTVRQDPPRSWQAAPVTWTSWAQTNIHPFADTDYTFESLT